MNKVQQKKKILLKVQKILEKELNILPSLNEVIVICAESYLHSTKLTKKQLKLIEGAAQASNKTVEQILSTACDWANKFYTKKYKVDEEKGEYQAGTAYRRIDAFVKKLMTKNNSAKKKEDKVFINQTYLSKNQGSNREAIKGYLKVNERELKEHHRKHSLSENHNVLVNNFMKVK